MAGVVRLEHVALPTTEETFAATVNFYKEHFGWHTLREIGTGGSRIAFLSDDDRNALEVYVAEGAPMTHPAHIAFAVPLDEYDEVKSRLESAGVIFDVDRTNAAGDRLGYFDDPAGNRAQICGRLKPLRD